jgi:hypothetical protein
MMPGMSGITRGMPDLVPVGSIPTNNKKIGVTNWLLFFNIFFLFYFILFYLL